MAMTLVSTVTVGSGGAASIEFTNIPQTGKDLLVLYSARGTGTGTYVEWNINNQGIGTNLTGRLLTRYGANLIYTEARYGEYANAPSNSTSDTFGSASIYMTNYTSSSNKSMSSDWTWENNATNNDMGITASQWAQTTAITSFTIRANSGVFAQNTTASLYIIS